MTRSPLNIFDSQPGQWVLLRASAIRGCDWVPLSLASGDGGSGVASLIILDRGEGSWGGACAAYADPMQPQLLDSLPEPSLGHGGDEVR